MNTTPRLKAMSGNIHLPIIFLTALDSQDTLLQCLKVGGDDFLSIPFEPVVLQAKVNAHARVRELSYSLVQKNRALAWHSARMEREQNVVQHMLENALAENQLDFPFIRSYLRPTSNFNGDVCLGRVGPFGNYYLFLGDFTGHGLAPATGALPVAQAFFSMAERGLSVGDMVTEFNSRLYKVLPDDMFCAALVVEMSANGDRISCWSGGMPDALLLDGQGQLQHPIKPQHMALGILPRSQFNSQLEHYFVSPGQRLVMFTDGVVEACNNQDEMIGEARFADWVTEMLDTGCSEAQFKAIVERIVDFTGEVPLNDDLSLVCLKCQPTRLEPIAKPLNDYHLPFQLRVVLTEDDIQNRDPMQRMVDSLTKLDALQPHKTSLYLLFAESFNNLLEHSVLGMQSKLKQQESFERYYEERQSRIERLQGLEIYFDINYQPDVQKLSFTLSSNTEHRFDGRHNAKASEVSEETFGRGLNLITQVADKVEWRDNGSLLFVSYTLSRPLA
ncbi:serine phosphatase RsbU (regulator of sigma subunit) [Idiomarina fontislapidosi]|uniref:PP2C family protein-serine/threonine phosphatase n=1 Tax=Idiomarina fontislapidosi TaxID=263723 RepID=UPI000D83A11B|nr:PP2C family protein-serine/threonine phosphatase [Idiomarina fontislapidosi]PYE31203.1 serine phosphatase RsbU (regulator of sigma subunit) [Idiomarina fontislapidosi]